jgi:hypothetical protein
VATRVLGPVSPSEQNARARIARLERSTASEPRVIQAPAAEKEDA